MSRYRTLNITKESAGCPTPCTTIDLHTHNHSLLLTERHSAARHEMTKTLTLFYKVKKCGIIITGNVILQREIKSNATSHR
jgi:hypothetical protein